MDTHFFLAAVAGAYLLAGFVKGVIGMGLPGVAIGLLGLIVTPAQAAAILLFPSFATNVWQGLAGGDLRALLRRLGPMLCGICIGSFIGAVTLPQGEGKQATVWLGVVLAAYAMLGLLKVHFFVPPRAEGRIGFVVGIVNGVIAVATGVFAIPGVPYIHALRLERDDLVQALGLYFTVSTVALALALWHFGELRLSLVGPALSALVLALVGMRLGQIVRGKVTLVTFRLWFFVGLLALGIRLALSGWL
ncbi:MAG: sulfite exporter TauE/SafE family protein [Pseudolabrys sp.]